MSALPVALVVEDDDDVRLLWSILLERGGWQAVPATNQREALDAAAAQPPDVILLDLHLRGGSGWDVLDALDESPALAEVPVIVLTGSPDIPSKERLGRATYLSKPVSGAQLLGAIRAAHKG